MLVLMPYITWSAPSISSCPGEFLHVSFNAMHHSCSVHITNILKFLKAKQRYLKFNMFY